MVDKVTNDEGEIQNKTGTELDVLAKMEKAFYRNNENAQKRNTQKSLKWFSKYIPRSMNKVRTSQMFRDRSLWADRIEPGRMMFFEYDAKHKDTLPVWDQYPLVFAWETWRGGDGKYGEPGVQYMIAINMHYLPPALRFAAMKALLGKRNEKRYRKSTRLKISWDILKGMSQSKYFEHSVKIYRMDQVKSKFIIVPAQSWEMVLYLPLARWKNGSKSKAWNI